MFRSILRLRVELSHVSDVSAELGCEISDFVRELAEEVERAASPADRRRILDAADAALTELLAAAYGLGLGASLD